VFVGLEGDDAIVKTSGFVIDTSISEGGLVALTAHFQPCHTTVVVPPATVLVETGAMPWSVVDMWRVPDVEGVVEFEAAGCGERWVRAVGAPCGGGSLERRGRARAFFDDGAVLVCPPDTPAPLPGQ
jgi:hypothetical protein